MQRLQINADGGSGVGEIPDAKPCVSLLLGSIPSRSFVNQQSSDKAEESEQVKTECRYTMRWILIE